MTEPIPTLDELFCGNRPAIDFWMTLYRIAHIYDDLIDKDRDIPDQDVHDLIWLMLVDVQDNLFYQQHYHQLKPLMVNALIAYRASVRYEQEHDEQGQELGHVLRYAVGNVMVNAIYLCGGEAHANRHAPELYKRLCDDRLGDYLRENHAENQTETPADSK